MSNYHMKDWSISGGGKYGGLMLMWNNLVIMTIMDDNENFTNVYFSGANQPKKCIISDIYDYLIHYKSILLVLS